MVMNPLKDYVLVAEKKKSDENITESGIILTSADNSRGQTAVVLAVGPEVTTVQVGDIVVPDWNNSTVHDVFEDGKKYPAAILKEKHLFGKM
jgi:co-chaperonin GroES (HSP10)